MQDRIKTLSFLPLLTALLAGTIFGVGLSLSEMVNPEKVLAFLDIAGNWDPSLIFVMGGALCITLPGFQLMKKMHRPVLELDFSMPVSRELDRKLLSGAVIFGIGWGIAGLCPGPAITGLASLKPEILLFVLAMLAGFFTHRLLLDR